MLECLMQVVVAEAVSIGLVDEAKGAAVGLNTMIDPEVIHVVILISKDVDLNTIGMWLPKDVCLHPPLLSLPWANPFIKLLSQSRGLQRCLFLFSLLSNKIVYFYIVFDGLALGERGP
jgi:hypothetical protein